MLANAAKRCKQESEMTCSAARITSSTRAQIKQSEGIPLCWQRPSSVRFSLKEICPETKHEHVWTLACQFFDVWQGFYSRQCRKQVPLTEESQPSTPKSWWSTIWRAVLAWTRRRTRPRKGWLSWSRANRAPEPKVFTLKALKTKAKSARCRAVLHRARFYVSRAFVRMWQEETKKGAV